MPVRRDQVPISVVIVIVIILMVVKDAVIGVARWGNLVMAALLIIMLVVYLTTNTNAGVDLSAGMGARYDDPACSS